MGKWPILDKIEMIDSPIDEKTYERDLAKLQHRLLDLQVHHMRTGGRALIGLDGWDAAGKGGLIERIIAGLEPKSGASVRRRPRNRAAITCGASGNGCRRRATGRSSIAPGTAACWSSE
jgi:Polyphosphate kinase 2 (PPK2)